METKIKTFDAVEMSRRLRENTSRKFNAMSREERLAACAKPANGFAPGGKPGHTPRRADALSFQQPPVRVTPSEILRLTPPPSPLQIEVTMAL